MSNVGGFEIGERVGGGVGRDDTGSGEDLERGVHLVGTYGRKDVVDEIGADGVVLHKNIGVSTSPKDPKQALNASQGADRLTG